MALDFGVEVLHKQITSPETPRANFTGAIGVKPSVTTLPKGFKKNDETRSFQVSTVWEKDIEIQMRDGIKLRADIFRPSEATKKIPILMAYSPYGKSGTGYFSLDMIPGRVGIPKSQLSGFDSFEAPDPAEWTAHGYAIVNVDARGIFGSGGNHRWHGKGEGQDGYDAIEFVSQLPWCNGNVALVGNSWLASNQWFIAAERPPHLSCILPLEGLSDAYRETLCRGGVPYEPFWNFLSGNLFGLLGQNLQEDTISMIRKYPLMNDYWEDKRAKAHLIEVPAYVLASMSTGLHTPPLNNIPFKNWPVPEAKYHTFFLSNAGRLSKDESSVVQGEVSYQSDAPAQQVDNDSEEVAFRYTFTEQATLIGASKALLWISCPDHNDFDVFVQIRKADKTGKILQNLNMPLNAPGMPSEDEISTINTLKYLGPTGILRASHRAIDPVLSKPHWPAHDHTKLRTIPPGQAVLLEIGLWPAAIQFETEESLVIKVAGHPMTLAEFEPLRGQFLAGNKGKHTLHYGGEFDSRLEVPIYF
ncbi:alpha/beta-hydrolase [Hyaloscypha variabilis]